MAKEGEGSTAPYQKISEGQESSIFAQLRIELEDVLPAVCSTHQQGTTDVRI